MNTLYLGKLEHADPLYEILSSKVCPAVKDPIFHVDSMSNRSVYKYTEEKTGDEDLLESAAIQTLLNGGTVYMIGAEKMPDTVPLAAVYRY